MKDRSLLLLAVTAVLAVLAIYINLDIFVDGYVHSPSALRFVPWQGEDLLQRSLKIKEGLDIQGGLQVLLRGNMAGRETGDLQRAASIIQSRVDSLGVTEPLIQTQGNDKIVVELPGVRDPELAVRTIGETALLEYIYSGNSYLNPGDTVSTTWRVSQTLHADLPPEGQRPHQALLPVDAQKNVSTSGDEATGDETAAAKDAETAEARDQDETATAEAAAAGDQDETATAQAAATGDQDETATAQAAGAGDQGGTATAEDAETAGASDQDSTATAEAAAAGEEDSTATAEAAAAGEEDAAAAGGEERTIYPSVITGEYLQQASVGLDTMTNQIIVNFLLTSDGARLLADFTREHHDDDAAGTKEVMPITLDGRVISSPSVRDEISGGQGMITGNFTRPEAESLVAQLNSGALPVELSVVGQTLVGPTLGRESVDHAVRGGILGMLVVMLFMLLYYRFPGFLAGIALVLYALFTLALFRLVPVTLTLAGIAGFVLSLGMAVDANILIFERMKEELRADRRLSAAIDVGFRRAWPSIRDSNISTIITCWILIWFGNQFGASIVKGFALTLFLGVITSMFTAIVVTRSLLLVSTRLFVKGDESGDPKSNPRLRALFGF